VQCAPASIQNQQPLRGKDPRVELPEGLGQGIAGLVCGCQSIHGIRRGEQLPRLFYQRRDPLVEDDAACRPRRVKLLLVDQPVQLFARRKGNMVDFGKVVVFRGQPEKSRVRMTRRRRLPRPGQSRRGLERRKSGPPKSPTCCPVTTTPAPWLSPASAAAAAGEGEAFCSVSSRTNSGQCGEPADAAARIDPWGSGRGTGALRVSGAVVQKSRLSPAPRSWDNTLRSTNHSL